MEYQYSLERHHSGNIRKYTCPKCGRTKCFTRYVNNDTGEYLSDDCGKCDHDNSCKYHYTPRDYFRDHPSLSTGWTPRPAARQNLRQAQKPERVAPVEKPLCVIDGKYVASSQSGDSQFMDWLTRTVGDAEAVERVYADYFLGATKDRRVIFWQIDLQGRTRTGKIMCYSPDGHRQGNPNWVHAVMKQELPEKWELTQCLFGEHLLRIYPQRQVCLVESEKTAVVCSAFLPEYVWVATGGCGGLSAGKILPLAGREVTVLPDSGKLIDWQNKICEAQRLHPGLMATRFRFDTSLEAYEGNTDIADILLHEARKR